jgi:hypothetical protein
MSDLDVRPFLLALMAMNVRTMSEIAAMAPTPEKAREIMFHFEQTVLDDIGKLSINLRSDETEEDLKRLQQVARDLVGSLLSSTRFQ